MAERKKIIPGEMIIKGENYLPGEGTEKRGNEIFSLRYGLVEELNRLIKVIPLSGTYQPRRGNVIIGKVEDITFNGWIIDIDAPNHAFLPLTEVPTYVNRNALNEVMDIGEMVTAKIFGVNRKGIDLSIKSRELGKMEEGIILKINPNKVPRVIGKGGSMINLIKNETKCNITIGQNGLIWIKSDEIENELFAKKAILFVAERSFVGGLTEELKKWLEKEKK